MVVLFMLIPNGSFIQDDTPSVVLFLMTPNGSFI